MMKVTSFIFFSCYVIKEDKPVVFKVLHLWSKLLKLNDGSMGCSLYYSFYFCVFFLKVSTIKHFKKSLITPGEEYIHGFPFRRVLINQGIRWNAHPLVGMYHVKIGGGGCFRLKKVLCQKF